MSNFDELKIKTEQEKDSETIVSVIEPLIPIEKPKHKAISLFSVLYTTLKSTSCTREDGKTIPTLKFAILTFLFVLVSAIVLSICSFFIDKTLLIPLALLLCSFGVPSILIVAFYELNFARTINIFQIALMASVGVVFYIILDLVCNNILSKYIFDVYVNSIIYPIFWVILMLLAVYFFSSIFKLSLSSEYFLCAVSIAFGYSIVSALHFSFTSLFVETEIQLATGDNNLNISYMLPVIINNSTELGNSLNSMLSSVVLSFIVMPILTANWSVMVCSPSALGTNDTLSKPHITLIFLSIVFFFLVEVETNFVAFNVILKLISLAATIVISIILINTSLNKVESVE